MYVKEKDKNQEAAVKQAQLEEEVVSAFAGDNNALNDEEVQQLVDAKEVEMKAKMKELVQSEDGGAMTMLRYFFPENLVYYDEGGYVFAPILDTLKKHQLVDENFHIQAQPDELYDYVRIDDINRLDECAGLERVTIFSPDGASDYMRTRLNRMNDETFARFIEYQKCISERADLIGAGSHVVDVVRV